MRGECRGVSESEREFRLIGDHILNLKAKIWGYWVGCWVFLGLRPKNNFIVKQI